MNSQIGAYADIGHSGQAGLKVNKPPRGDRGQCVSGEGHTRTHTQTHKTNFLRTHRIISKILTTPYVPLLQSWLEYTSLEQEAGGGGIVWVHVFQFFLDVANMLS